jgi:hypothetical protein
MTTYKGFAQGHVYTISTERDEIIKSFDNQTDMTSYLEDFDKLCSYFKNCQNLITLYAHKQATPYTQDRRYVRVCSNYLDILELMDNVAILMSEKQAKAVYNDLLKG